jgi:hypothetical protein
MLYDPKWEQETKADPFSLENLIAWLEKRPAGQEYDFNCWGECLLGQWLRSIDPASMPIDGKADGYFYSALGQTLHLDGFKHIAFGDSSGHTRTFGKALERARRQTS